MTCQQCGHADATVHLTDVVDQVRRERHLCAACADAEKLFGPADPADPDTAAGLNLQALVELMFQSPAPPTPPAATAGLNCPACGLQYAAFRATGRLGCAADYDAFRSALLPLLERLHRGAGHDGKRPRRLGAYGLRARLARAVADEDFAAAARLRDELRRMECER